MIPKVGESMRHPDLWNQLETREDINVLIYIKELEYNRFDKEFEKKFKTTSLSTLSEITYIRKYRGIRRI